MARLSLRARLVLGVLLLAIAGLAAADAATYRELRSFLLERVDQSLVADSGALRRPDFRGGGPGPRGDHFNAPDVWVQTRTSSGKVLTDSGVPHLPGSEASAPPRIPATIDFTSADQVGPDLVRYLTVPATSGGGRWRVRATSEPDTTVQLVATSLADVDATLHRLLLIELLVTGAVAGGIALLGLWIVRLGLRPLDAIGRTADAIAAGDLSQRVERAESRTEVGRLGLALNEMLGRIETSDRRLRRFVADASHELRTPLAAVRAYAELFGRGADKRPEDLGRAMAGISRESERMSALVDDLLLLARLDEGRPLEQEPVRLDELAAEAVETARTVEPSRAIELAAEPAVVIGDRVRLRQVLDNLLANVRAHTPPGTAARVSVHGQDGRAVLEVADEGPGMTAEESARVFERFYRSDPSRARNTGGVGLGLAIVAAVAEAHGGSVSVRGTDGSGTTFRVELPAA